ncbi:MAG: hypothetical protein WBN08_12720, partial [Thiogranum sp.]
TGDGAKDAIQISQLSGYDPGILAHCRFLQPSATLMVLSTSRQIGQNCTHERCQAVIPWIPILRPSSVTLFGSYRANIPTNRIILLSNDITDNLFVQ